MILIKSHLNECEWINILKRGFSTIFKYDPKLLEGKANNLLEQTYIQIQQEIGHNQNN